MIADPNGVGSAAAHKLVPQIQQSTVAAREVIFHCPTPESEDMTEVNRFLCLIPVKKLDRAISFYTEKLGGKLVSRGPGDMEEWSATISIGKDDFLLVTPEEIEKRELSYNMLIVKDIKETVSRLRARGVRFARGEKLTTSSKVDGPISFDTWGATAFFNDSEGNLLTLFQEAS